MNFVFYKSPASLAQNQMHWCMTVSFTALCRYSIIFLFYISQTHTPGNFGSFQTTFTSAVFICCPHLTKLCDDLSSLEIDENSVL